MPETLSLPYPDDWHCHLRDDDALQVTVPHIARSFRRAIVMPNLALPVITADDALAYRKRIDQHAKKNFTPLMTLYLVDDTSVETIQRAKTAGITACKLYPQGATTLSDSGISDISKLDDVFNAMADNQLPLLIHGEVVDNDIDIFDREAVFLERHLSKIIEKHPKLKIVLEHVTTEDGIEFVKAHKNMAATITAHHLFLNRNDILVGGIKPHHYCLPVAKRETHRQALIQAATSGSPQFFLGTDSAPHARAAKESPCGCAGIYTAPHALSLYAEIFDSENAMDKLANFASRFGPKFYGLPENTDTLTLVKKPWTVPDNYPYCGDTLVPFKAGDSLSWQVLEQAHD